MGVIQVEWMTHLAVTQKSPQEQPSRSPAPHLSQVTHTSLTITNTYTIIYPVKSDEKLKQTRRTKEVTPIKTINWQTKALTLFIAAVALWLTAACGNNEVEEYAIGDRKTPSAPCGPDIPLTPSIEYITLEGAKVPSGYEKALEAAKNPGLIGIPDAGGRERFIHSIRNTARAERLRPETERIKAIIDEYEDLIWSQNPSVGGFVHGFGMDIIKTEDGISTDKQVIGIYVTELSDQSALPPEVRIPECIDGVEVHFIVQGPMAPLEF